MANILSDTDQLKKLLSKAEDTGKIAWQIGQTASQIYENGTFKDFPKKNYTDFGEFTNGEFNKTEQTISIYIKIFKSFSFEDIGDLLFTHLKELTRIPDKTIRKSAVKVFNKLQRQYLENGDKNEKERMFSAESIKATIGLINRTNNPTEDEIGDIAWEVTKIKERKTGIKGADKVGEVLKNTKFDKLERWLAFEPIDEQGTVALFCLLLPLLEEVPFTFKLDGHYRNGTFSQFEFVRSKFPDACIHFNTEIGSYKTVNYKVLVEFEFYSSSYIEHLMSYEKCHLIICWVNNIDRNRYTEDIFPPIIELSEVIKTGQIIVK